ncbi:MAG: hypothetical protein HY906_08355 [Deltaproteobacteria bacterium]|nr:hypothetical protein [Deltaproteobacteria bacterium]
MTRFPYRLCSRGPQGRPDAPPSLKTFDLGLRARDAVLAHELRQRHLEG